MINRELQCFILVIVHLIRSSVVESLTLKSDCICPGYPLIYECTVYGEPGGTTVWTGTAFSCINREISLFHGDYRSAERVYGECDNIKGWILRTVKNTNSSTAAIGYVSQMIVRVRSDTIGKSIECQYDDGTTSTQIGQTATVTATIAPFSPPERIYLSKADLSASEITFKWSPVASDCPAISYNILTSNCGSCPTTTNHTNVTCTNVPTNDKLCTFALETVVCGHIVGNKSESIQGILKGCSGCTGAIVSASILAITLTICVVVFNSGALRTGNSIKHACLNISATL